MLKATCQEEAGFRILWCCKWCSVFSEVFNSHVPPCDGPEECWALCSTARNGNSERIHGVYNRAGKHHHNFIAQVHHKVWGFSILSFHTIYLFLAIQHRIKNKWACSKRAHLRNRNNLTPAFVLGNCVTVLLKGTCVFQNRLYKDQGSFSSGRLYKFFSS